MGAQSGMDAFLENPMFLFVDDADPILPIFQSTNYGDTGRIVELTDVGCDTETTFPIRFPRGASDRRRGGAESLRSTRRNAKWLNDKPNEFARRVTDINNIKGRNKNHIRRKTQRDDYDDVYIADLDYDDLFTESPDDLELPKNDSATEEEDDYYAQFVNPRNTIVRSRKERIPRSNYSRNLESSFTRNIRLPQRENTSRWFGKNDEKNNRETHNTNIQLDKRKKRTNILSRNNGNFNSEGEFGKIRETIMHHERDDLPNIADSNAPTKNIFWDFIPFENDTDCEETTFCNPTRTKSYDKLQKMALHGRRSYILDSQSKFVDTVDLERGEEFGETIREDRQENLSPAISLNNARNRTLKGDAVKEKPKILRLNKSNVISLRGRSMRTSIDEEILDMFPADENSNNTRSQSATEGKKLKSPTMEKREEIANATQTIVDDRRYRYKFDKLSNNSPKEMSQSTRMFNLVTDSKSNERIYKANKKDNTNPPRENSGNNKIDRINVAMSRSAPEEKVMKNERTFTLRKTDTSVSRTDMAKNNEKKFSSKLPIRTWKRLRTKGPTLLRPENDVTHGEVNRKFQEVENETAKSNDHWKMVGNDGIRLKDHIAANHNDVKRSKRFKAESLSTNKPGLTSDLKSVKGNKGLNTVKETYEQRKKRTSVK